MSAFTINLSSVVKKISDDELLALSCDNPDARLETDSNGHLIFMSPTGKDTIKRF